MGQKYKLGRGNHLIESQNELVIVHKEGLIAFIVYSSYLFVSYLIFSNVLISTTLFLILSIIFFYKTIITFHSGNLISKDGFLFKFKIYNHFLINKDSCKIEISIKTSGGDDQGGTEYVYHFELVDKDKRYNMIILNSYKSQEILIKSIENNFNIPIIKKYPPGFPKLGVR